MLGKLTLAAAFGAGYVLGAKAGKQRYDEIMTKAREIAGKPAVQDLRDSVTTHAADAAATVGEKAKAAASDAVAGVTAKVNGDGSDNADEPIDLTKSTTAKAGARPLPTG